MSHSYACHCPLPPSPVNPQRLDGLWNTTCFEAFYATPGIYARRTAYTELNLSPSGNFNAYAFTVRPKRNMEL